MYRVGIRGDEEQPYKAGSAGEQSIFKTKGGDSYATNDWGSVEPMSPLGVSKVQAQTPAVMGVTAPAPRILDVGKYQGGSTTPVPLPNQDIQNAVWDIMPNEATPSAVAMAGENARFDVNAKNVNNDGSVDYGLMQNNDRTLNELLSKQKFAEELNNAGIYKPEDVLGDARRSLVASKVTRAYEDAPRWTGDTEGRPDWSSWYGWQNKGYTIDPNKTIQQVAENPAYFKLAEFIARMGLE